MNVKRKINYVIMALCALIAILALAQPGWHEGFTWAAVAILARLIHLVLPEGNGILYVEQEPPELLREMRLPEGTTTELALLCVGDVKEIFCSFFFRTGLFGQGNGIYKLGV